MQEAAEASDSPTRTRILAVAEERFAAFGYRRTGIGEIARDAGVAPGTLARLGEASVDHNRENALINSVYRRDGEIIFAPLLEELHEQLVRENVTMIADVIRDGIREGTLRAVDPERTAFVLFTGGDALSSQSHYPYQDVLPLYGEIVMHGLVPR